MALTNEERRTIWAEIMEYWSDNREEITGITKQELRTGLDAFDQALDDNAATMNQWFPQPVRGALSSRQKLEVMLRLLTGRR